MSHIKLTPTDEVREALQLAFPRSNVDRALSKYTNALQSQINAAILNGRAPEDYKLDLYSISLHELTHTGGQIGPSKIRLHKWLAENGLALVVTATAGSKFSGKLSQVKLTDRVLIETLAIDDETTDAIEHVTDYESKRRAFIERVDALYPGLSQYAGDTQAILQDYDLSPVSIQSLRNYIVWLGRTDCQLSRRQQERELAQARYVLNAAVIGSGSLLQKKKRSVFGRTYYDGLSVQSVSKTLRRAMLGTCWEYDMRACVIAWKLGFAKDCCEYDDDERDPREVFAASFKYLVDKTTLIHQVCQYVFDAHSYHEPARQIKLIKQAFTAISFGAREKAVGWLSQDGKRHNAALASIFSNAAERQRFIECASVRAFIDEQKQLDTYITRTALSDKPNLRSFAPLLTKSGRLSKPKLMAMLYQTAEARVMSLIDECLLASGYGVIARIHDAIIVSQLMPVSFREHLIKVVRGVTHNDYWHLCETAHERFV